MKEVVQIFQKQELPEEEEDDISFDEPLQEILENDEDQD